MSAVAAAMTGTGRPLGVVPLGTHNHFAKDMNVPLDLDAAVRTLARGTVRLLFSRHASAATPKRRFRESPRP